MGVIECSKEIAEILKQVEAQRPEYPSVLVDNLYRRPEFTGWHGTVDGISEWDIKTFEILPKDTSAIGYFSFWKVRASKDTVFWVGLPSLIFGEAKRGAAVEIGPQRVHAGDYLKDELDSMVRQGYEIIMKMVAERGEYREA